ncbi:high-affinity glucose transporter RGT2 [Nannizzia gypsea CBS 118893]|uniref:High-affinity glucose transporter RGT2 n=1 Tax=Arthroderma gypseum (strain ATCC MYA-4604 / CBS 118893) TaxID=535722 RepID=E4UUU6_ARTGP|nr:high-affinity glucose transporter RGT2 [Nannizzia gypsea CBS 118893]EFR01063.1 high-affinity glucose transporter RGT2 [Nannizzia gypsea CBS 118893]
MAGTADVSRVEAPVTLKAYLMCAFAAFGGIFFGFDSGYINGVMGMEYFITLFTGLKKSDFVDNPEGFTLPSWQKSLITSILSAGTFFGAIAAGDLADFIGRRTTIIIGCGIFIVGVILQTALRASTCSCRRLIAASASEGQRRHRLRIPVLHHRGPPAGLCVDYGTQSRQDSGSYRIPIALQMLWALILGGGLFLLPESPRYFVKRGRLEDAQASLARLRGQDRDSDYIREELAEIVANHEYEMQAVPQGYWASWLHCFHGSLFNPASNLRRIILGTALQMFQQFTGINFIFYFGTTFFQDLGTIENPFLIGLITTLVNVCSTPISFWTIERFGRRALLIWGAVGMFTCEFIVAIIGVTDGQNRNAVQGMIALICIYIFFFASTWGPGAWVVIGEIYPLPIRSRGVGLSTASNWLWNCIIAVITPFLVGTDKANLGAKVFFIWGSLCVGCFLFAFFLIPETKGLTLEQVDKMMEETTPIKSASWKPHTTFAAEMGHVATGGAADEKSAAFGEAGADSAV